MLRYSILGTLGAVFLSSVVAGHTPESECPRLAATIQNAAHPPVEKLVLDARSGLSPSQQVEKRVQEKLKEPGVGVSHLTTPDLLGRRPVGR